MVVDGSWVVSLVVGWLSVVVGWCRLARCSPTSAHRLGGVAVSVDKTLGTRLGVVQ